MPTSGSSDVTVWAGYASGSSKCVTYITDAFTLTAPAATSSPTRMPSKRPTPSPTLASGTTASPTSPPPPTPSPTPSPTTPAPTPYPTSAAVVAPDSYAATLTVQLTGITADTLRSNQDTFRELISTKCSCGIPQVKQKKRETKRETLHCMMNDGIALHHSHWSSIPYLKKDMSTTPSIHSFTGGHYRHI